MTPKSTGSCGLDQYRVLMNLDEVFKGWKMMSVIAPRTAAIYKSIVGGQGIFQCKNMQH